MQNRKQIVLAAMVTVLLGSTAWAQTTYGNGMYGDSTRTNKQMGSARDSVSNDMSNDTAKNRQGVTASDQSNDKSDIDITAKIRRQIMDTKGMSINAQNVKIVTVGGKVTLKGKVNSANEKKLVGQIANNVVSNGSVTNELLIK